MSGINTIGKLIVTGALTSTSGRDINPRETQEWLNDLHDFVGDIVVKHPITDEAGDILDPGKAVHVDRWLDAFDARADALRSKIAERWASLPNGRGEELLAALADLEGSVDPLKAPENNPEGWKRALAFAGALTTVGQQIHAGTQVGGLYDALNAAQGGRSLTQSVGLLASPIVGLEAVADLAFQRLLFPAATAFAAESVDKGAGGKKPEGYGAGVTTAAVLTVLGYMVWQDRLSRAGVRSAVKLARFFVSSDEDALRREMGEEGGEWLELLDNFKALQFLRKDDLSDPTKGLNTAANMQAAIIKRKTLVLVRMLNLSINSAKTSPEQGSINSVGYLFAIGATGISTPELTLFAVILQWAIVFVFRLRNTGKRGTIDDTSFMIGQAGFLVLAAVPFLVGLIVCAQHGVDPFKTPWVTVSSLVWLPTANMTVAHLSGYGAQALYTAGARGGQSLKNLMPMRAIHGASSALTVLVAFADRAVGAKSREVAGAVGDFLISLGVRPEAEAKKLLVILRQRDTAVMDPAMGATVAGVALREAATSEARVVEINDEQSKQEIASYTEKMRSLHTRLQNVVGSESWSGYVSIFAMFGIEADMVSF